MSLSQSAESDIRNAIPSKLAADALIQNNPQTELFTANGTAAIKAGVIFIGGSAARTITIDRPTSGIDNGKRLAVVAITAQAHVITCEINVTNTTGTFAAATGNSIDLVAYNGFWHTIGTPLGVTIS